MFAALQGNFAQSLLDPERPLPSALTSRHADIPQKRFAVYRNNVIVGLVNAMREGFPAVERIVGEEFFAAMARCFVLAHPPRSPVLMRYGEDFGDFIAGFPPAADLPYLPDVARLEFARRRAYHAADVAPIDPARLATLEPAALAEIRITLHPSVGILRSRHPLVTIWAMNSGGRELAPIDEDQAEDALVVRLGLDVTVRSLPPGGAEFLHALAKGLRLRAAAEAAIASDPRFDPAVNLAGLIGSGAMTNFSKTDSGALP
jgi:hypothetical protein